MQRLIDMDNTISELKTLPEQERLEFIGVYDLLKSMPSIDAKPVEYQPMSKDFARMITKGIASRLSELQLDLPSIIYEGIESNLLKGKFADVECFIQNYLKNNGAKMDEVQDD